MARSELVDDELWELVKSLLLDRRRPGLRPRQLPARVMAPRRQTGHRSPRNRARLRARAMALGRRAYLRVAAQLPSPTHPLGTRPGRAYGLPHPRLRTYLPTRYLREF